MVCSKSSRLGALLRCSATSDIIFWIWYGMIFMQLFILQRNACNRNAISLTLESTQIYSLCHLNHDLHIQTSMRAQASSFSTPCTSSSSSRRSNTRCCTIALPRARARNSARALRNISVKPAYCSCVQITKYFTHPELKIILYKNFSQVHTRTVVQ